MCIENEYMHSQKQIAFFEIEMVTLPKSKQPSVYQPAPHGMLLVNILYTFVIAIIGIASLFFLPRYDTFLWYWCDHLSYFSQISIASWTIFCIALIWIAKPIQNSTKKFPQTLNQFLRVCLIPLALVVILISFHIFRTPFPSFHGDGANGGGGGADGDARPALNNYPADSGRLHAFILAWMTNHIHLKKDYKKEECLRTQHPSKWQNKNNTWIALTIVTGFITSIILAVWSAILDLHELK